MKILTSILIMLCLLGSLSYSQSNTVRLKDIGKLIESRDNQLAGYGIVVGLRGSGDSRAAGLTNNALRNLLSKMGVSISGVNLNARNATLLKGIQKQINILNKQQVTINSLHMEM